MLNISFALSLDSIDCSTFPVHTYILTPSEEKSENQKRKVFHAVNVETALSFGHVGTIRHMADRVQVSAVVGMDNGISGSETKFLCFASVGA